MQGLIPKNTGNPFQEIKAPTFLEYITQAFGGEKVVFLGKENLEVLSCHKAIVVVRDGIGGTKEVHVVLTGFHEAAANRLVRDLIPMKPEEIKGS